MDKKDFFLLLDRYLNGRATPEEERQLLNYYSSFQKDTDDHVARSLDERLEEKMLTGIMHRIHKREEEPPVRSLWRKAAVAAMILITLSVSAYLYTGGNHQKVAQALTPVKKDVSPGKDKAILTLANGSIISLDEVATGKVAAEGNTIITKTADGQIEYLATQKHVENSHTKSHQAMNTIYTPRGGKYRIVLPDGSQVWLNSESSLRYPTAFSKSERRVKLTGEAYFEIAKNKQRPFRVESNGQVVEVLGTHFNISSYEDERVVKTTLLEGSVRVIHRLEDGEGAVKLLKPGEQSLISPDQAGIKVESTNTDRAMAWKNGYFQFQNTHIEEVMREVSRWYDVEVEYSGRVPEEEFTGFISRKVKLSVVLKILEQGGGVRFSINGRKVNIKSAEYTN